MSLVADDIFQPLTDAFNRPLLYHKSCHRWTYCRLPYTCCVPVIDGSTLVFGRYTKRKLGFSPLIFCKGQKSSPKVSYSHWRFLSKSMVYATCSASIFLTRLRKDLVVDRSRPHSPYGRSFADSRSSSYQNCQGHRNGCGRRWNTSHRKYETG